MPCSSISDGFCFGQIHKIQNKNVRIFTLRIKAGIRNFNLKHSNQSGAPPTQSLEAITKIHLLFHRTYHRTMTPLNRYAFRFIHKYFPRAIFHFDIQNSLIFNDKNNLSNTFYTFTFVTESVHWYLMKKTNEQIAGKV